jgi:hypothetical protein
VDDTQSSVSWDQVSQANAHQPGEYLVVVPEGGDRISQVTSKYSGGDIIITAPYAYMSSDTHFFYMDL